MNDVNELKLQGRITKYPEVSKLDNGTPIVRFSIAVNRYRKESDGNYTKYTDFFNLAIFGKLAEYKLNDLEKGNCVLVFGSLRQHKWCDKDGTTRETVGIQVERLFVEKRNQRAEESPVPEAVNGPSASCGAEEKSLNLSEEELIQSSSNQTNQNEEFTEMEFEEIF